MDTCQQLQRRGSWGEDLQLGRCTPPIGPRNTYSNLAYAIAGAVGYLLRPSALGVWFLLACLALCYGSWRYHSEKTVRANLLDRLGMFVVIVPLATLGLSRLDPHPLPPLFVMLFGTVVFTPLAVYLLPVKWMDAQIGMWTLFAAAGGFLRGNPWLTAASLGCFALAYWCWHLDKRADRPLGLWGHALWHVIGGPMFLCMFLGLT